MTTVVVDAPSTEAVKLIREKITSVAKEEVRIVTTIPRQRISTPRIYLVPSEGADTILPLKELQGQLSRELPPLLERGAVQIVIASELTM